MRVITGSARGCRLGELPGQDTRPTTDRVKESVFNILQFDIEGRRVLDLFAGTGQLGIECLSRGAESCVFVDQSQAATALVRRNLRHTGLERRSQVIQSEAGQFLAACRQTFHLIFLDPPYAGDLLGNTIKKIAAVDILADNGIMVCESPVDKTLPGLPVPYHRGKEYRYGKIKITLYRKDV